MIDCFNCPITGVRLQPTPRFIWREVVLIKIKKKNRERLITSKMCQKKIFLRLKLHDLIFSEIESQHFLVFFRLHFKRQTK